MRLQIVFLFSLIVMMGCSGREVNVSFLSSLKTGPFFQITNLEDGNVLRASRDEAFVSIEAYCSPGVERLEIEDPALDVSSHVHDLKRRCADDGKISFQLPTSLFHNLSSTAPGDFYQNITLRAVGSDPIRKEPIEHVQHLRVLYSPPHNSLMLPNYVNILATENETFSISGRCENPSDFIELSGAFEGSPKIVACNGSSFEQRVKVIATTESSVGFTLESRVSPNGRAYLSLTVPVSVDLEAPILNISSLAEGAVYNKSATEAGPLKIAGSCSEDLVDVTVQVWNGTALWEQEKVTCSLTHEYEYTVPWSSLPDGVLKIRAEQVDLAHNNGSSELSIEKRVSGPGVFQVLGLSSTGTGDADVDNVLKDHPPQVHFGLSSGAIKYSIKILPFGGNVASCEFEVTATPASLLSCGLMNSSQYVVKMASTDSYGNIFQAPDYKFTTNFVGPVITKVETDTAASSILVKDQFIDFKVYTDRPVKVITTDSYLNLVMTKTTGLSSDTKATLITSVSSTVSYLTYRYTVPVNVYSSALKIQSIVAVAGLTDSVTGVQISAALNPESNGNAHAVTAKNIVIDSLPPLAPEVLYVVSPKIATFSPIDWSANNDGSGARTYLRIKNLTTLENTSWQEATLNPYQFSSPTQGIGLGESYVIEAYTKDYAGNQSATTTFSFTSFVCPSQFAYVWDGVANPFCVAMFEGKGTIAAPQIKADEIPTILTSHIQAQTYCSSLGEKYKVVTNSQWQTMANLIVQQPSNWTGGNLLSGLLKVGNVAQGFGNTEPVDLGDPLAPNYLQMYSRVLNLPYGQKVWDLSGNASEYVMKDEAAPFYVSAVTPVELLLGDLKNSYGPRSLDCTEEHFPNIDPSKVIRCGFGSVSNSSDSVSFLYRGSHARGTEAEGGVFSAQESPGIGAAARCVFNP